MRAWSFRAVPASQRTMERSSHMRTISHVVTTLVVLLLGVFPAAGQSAKPTQATSLEQRVAALEKALRALQSELAAIRTQLERAAPGHAAAKVPSLSRDEARRLISEKYRLPAAQTTRIPRMALNKASSTPSEGGFMPAVTICQDLGTSWRDVAPRITQLTALGLLILGQKTQSSGKCVYEYRTIDLTSQGLPYLLSNDNEGFLLKTHTLAFGEISGVRTIQQLNVAEVDYTLVVQDVTPFAESVSSQPVRRTATFELFDDGWRIR